MWSNSAIWTVVESRPGHALLRSQSLCSFKSTNPLLPSVKTMIASLIFGNSLNLSNPWFWKISVAAAVCSSKLSYIWNWKKKKKVFVKLLCNTPWSVGGLWDKQRRQTCSDNIHAAFAPREIWRFLSGQVLLSWLFSSTHSPRIWGHASTLAQIKYVTLCQQLVLVTVLMQWFQWIKL